MNSPVIGVGNVKLSESESSFVSKIQSLSDITSQIGSPSAIRLATDTVSRGVDNYHADIEISPGFTLKLREAIAQNLKLLMAGKTMMSGNSEMMHDYRDAYADLVQTMLHRIKTDFTAGQVHVLQFGIVKNVIEEVRDAVDQQYESLEVTLGQQQSSGSRSLLATQERLAWFRAHSGEFVYRLTRLFLRAMQREENNQLRALREQFVGDFSAAVNLMFNPMLAARSPRDPLLQLDHYAVWPGEGARFDELNQAFEDIFKNHFPDQLTRPLKSDSKPGRGESEVYDALGGLFASQSMLGPAEDQKDRLREEFSWLDHPGNMRLLFDPSLHEQHLAQEGLGFAGTRKLKSELKVLEKVVAELRKAVGDESTLRKVLASYALRDKLQQSDLDVISIEDALELVAGRDHRKVARFLDAGMENVHLLQSKLEDCVKEFDRLYKESSDELMVRLLSDFSRYRLHLKFYRFAHRLFNRISVITNPDEIQLAKVGGNLYRLLSGAESRDAEDSAESEVVHHCVIKADVRGSTTVTRELARQDLNAASYFSLRFFNPIKERLGLYGATKVFIEGDAVILSINELNDAPDQWFSVSRSCGLAKEVLDIVKSKNAHSKQTGLPALELGIGICYRDERPMFLFDEDKPIMISPAIGDADRMSGCAWQLRDNIQPGHFNVGVFLPDPATSQEGEKGQKLLRYNVNGIVVDDAAFKKLQDEVHFTQVKVRSGGIEENFFVGQYPDIVGKKRDLVIRQGKVGVWRGDASVKDAETGLFFYEVLPNTKFAAQIVEMAQK